MKKIILLILISPNTFAEGYLSLGLLKTDVANSICKYNSADIIGNVELGYRVKQGNGDFEIFLRHDSCLDKSGDNENTLNAIGIRKEFKL